MITRKLFLVFGFLFILIGTNRLLAQSSTSTYPIILNEYCVTNVPNGYPDEKGMLSDYVEIYCNHTASISLSNFYLSNDKLNLLKWKFPSNFPALQPGGYYLVWLSGKNTNDGVNFHTNFTIEQCKNQWIIISNGSGVIYDSILVRPTKAGHVRGRVDMDNIGNGAWRLFTTKSPKFANGTPSAYGYAPTPKMYLSTATTFPPGINTGTFSPTGSQLLYMRLEGATYDSLYSCYDIFYTKNGDYPVPFYNSPVSNGNYYRYADSITPITVDATMMIRAIAVPKPNNPLCPINTLPSFCETNTYFIDPEYNSFTKEFGVVSIALDEADSSWFNSQGAYSASVHVEYYDNKKQVSEGYAMINRPPQEEWRTAQKGFYINIDDRLGFGCNFEGDIFNVDGLGTSTRTVFPTLHLKAGDFESFSQLNTGPAGTAYGTGIRDVVIQSLAAKYNLNVNPLHVKPVVTFVNGKYWGVYDLREVYDKYYEEYYNGQPRDQVDLNFVYNCQEGSVTAWDGPASTYTPASNFNTSVYNIAMTRPMTGSVDYGHVLNNLDKASFIDYMVLNSYFMNSDLWCNNVSLAHGGDPTKPGGKWHFYLWNMPATLNFTAAAPTGLSFPNFALPPCYLYNAVNPNQLLYDPTINKFNGHGNLLTKLMRNTSFKADYITRYQDLLNSALSCDNILAHFDYVAGLYEKEMKYHGDAASTPFPGKFYTTDVNHIWDTNAAVLRKVIQERCFYMTEAFRKESTCYGLQGQFSISVDVRPTGAGKVRLNTLLLDNYVWNGNYFGANLTFKALPASNEYVFDHWEFNGPMPSSSQALSMDSVVVNWNTNGNVVAVFTDKKTALASGVNIPTGFTPNGDGLNDDFKPLGAGEFATDYQMIVFNRWGQEVFRSVDPLTGWDGRYKGQDAQTGVYAYFITYKNIYNEDKLVKGNVTLTR